MSSLKYLLAFFVLQLGAQEVLEFRNGDKWVGQVKEFSQKSIILKSALTAEDLSFNVNNVRSLNFKKNDLLFKEKNTVHLTNGDTLVGNLLGMNEKQLTIDTTFAGVLILPKTSIKRILYNSLRPHLQTAKTLWPDYDTNTSPNNLKVKYDFDHPILIDATVSGNTPNLSFKIFEKNKKQVNPFSLMFYLRNYGAPSSKAGYVHGKTQNKKDAKTLSNLGNNVKLKVYINSKKGLFMFYVNGQRVAEFDLASKITWKNGIIKISSSGKGTSLNQFNISKWDGVKPISVTNQFNDKKMARINLRNGDVAFGKIININKEELRFNSVLGSLSIPISHISKVSLSNDVVRNSQNNFTLARDPLRISGDISLNADTLQVSNAYLSKAKLSKKHFWSLSHFAKLQKEKTKTEKRKPRTNKQKRTATLAVGENVIKGTIQTLKNGTFEVHNDNLIGKHSFNSHNLKSIDFTELNNIDKTVALQRRKGVKKNTPKSWTIGMTNGDSFLTTQYSLKGDSLRFALGELPLVLTRHQINKVALNQDRSRDRDFLQNMPDRYSMHFNVFLSGNFLKAVNENKKLTLFLINMRSQKTTTYLSFSNRLKEESSTQLIAGQWKKTPIPIKPHNKIVLKSHNHFEVKFDHKKGLIEVWANKQLLNSISFGKRMGKYQHLIRTNDSKSGLKLGPVSFRPSDKVNSESYVLDKSMKVYKDTISAIDQKNITLSDMNIKLENVSEIILNKKIVKPSSEDKAIIASKYGVFHVNHLEIENGKLNFKHSQNKTLPLPFEQITKINFLKKP